MKCAFDERRSISLIMRNTRGLLRLQGRGESLSRECRCYKARERKKSEGVEQGKRKGGGKVKVASAESEKRRKERREKKGLEKKLGRLKRTKRKHVP